MFFCVGGHRNQPSHLVGPPFPAFKARLAFPECKFVDGGCGWSHVSA